ncbi:MAG TPA: iron-containing redox enzyme family protein [Acidimicrobiales bacterium]|nr:iron-containing redox enzyme family protein [Acidimicrobiales bacterium]
MSTRPPQPLHDRLDRALAADHDELDRLASADALDVRDEALTLLAIHDLHVAPIDQLGERTRWQHHPAVARMKVELEQRYLARLGDSPEDAPENAAETAAAVRALVGVDPVPPVYRWVAEEAAADELIDFLALEGGPDGGFDDLVAACQVGIGGEAKLELARNYWDEMGQGDAADVHTELHRRLTRATGMRPLPPSEQPIEALERSLLRSLLATNRHLQPEMVGALGVVEMQAGPRCRKVVEGLRRIGAPDDALAFYVEHAAADPRHGKDWLDHVIVPLADSPRWAAGILRGVKWQLEVNRRFFAEVERRFVPQAGSRAA